MIGRDGALPWRLPGDLRRFKALTWGKPLLMGRRTFASIGRALPGRDTIVLTRDSHFSAPGVLCAPDIESALAAAEACRIARGAGEIVVAGGALVYADLIGRARKLHLTEVDVSPTGDAFFPPIDPAAWTETAREHPPRERGDEAAYAYVEWTRR